ncbi:MAG: 30S ribosomal protein S18 [Phycisphaerae bacterium]|nr:30S ribosomal protein S18 [Phycisphaerae bacterium]
MASLFSQAARKKRKRARRLAEASRRRVFTEKEKVFDYKDVASLQRLLTTHGKMFSRKRSGLNAREQRSAALAVKRARFMALLPYVG